MLRVRLLFPVFLVLIASLTATAIFAAEMDQAIDAQANLPQAIGNCGDLVTHYIHKKRGDIPVSLIFWKSSSLFRQKLRKKSA